MVMGVPPADVDDLAVGGTALHREEVGADDVVHADEVALLFAILKDERRLVVDHARGEDGGDTGVGVRERLARAVDIEEAKRGDRQIVVAPEDEAELLLIAFGERVDGVDLGRLCLVCGQRA